MQNPTYLQLFEKDYVASGSSLHEIVSREDRIYHQRLRCYLKKMEKWPRHCYDYLNKGLGNKMDVISFYINFPIRRFFIKILLII